MNKKRPLVGLFFVVLQKAVKELKLLDGAVTKEMVEDELLYFS